MAENDRTAGESCIFCRIVAGDIPADVIIPVGELRPEQFAPYRAAG